MYSLRKGLLIHSKLFKLDYIDFYSFQFTLNNVSDFGVLSISVQTYVLLLYKNLVKHRIFSWNRLGGVFHCWPSTSWESLFISTFHCHFYLRSFQCLFLKIAFRCCFFPSKWPTFPPIFNSWFVFAFIGSRFLLKIWPIATWRLFEEPFHHGVERQTKIETLFIW